MAEIVIAFLAFLGGFFGGPLGHVGACAQPSVSFGPFQAAVPIRAGLNPCEAVVH